MRSPGDRGGRVELARSDDGERFQRLLVLSKEAFGAESLERPALVVTPAGDWRLYVSCATPGSKHWRIDLLEAPTPLDLAGAEPLTVMPGDSEWGVKDPVIRFAGAHWHAWVCCHPLADPGEEDRMVTRYATSADGIDWAWHGDALAGRSGEWDARGARLTALIGEATYYDGRATKEENFAERTGVAIATGEGAFAAEGTEPIAAVRYVDAIALPGGGHRLYYEAPRPDGAHELRTELGVRPQAERLSSRRDPGSDP